MRSLVAFFIDRPKLVNLLVIFIMLAGFLSFKRTENQGYPPVDFGMVTITTVYPGSAPEDVEIKITSKLEEKLKGISGIKKYQSASLEGLSIITIYLEDHADYTKTKSDISKAIDQVEDLPTDILNRPIVKEIDNKIYPVSEVALVGDADYATKRAWAKKLENRLENANLVGEIEKVGYLKQEYIIKAHQSKLNNNYISLTELIRAVQSQNIRISAGDIPDKNNEKKLVIHSELNSIPKLENAIIKTSFDGPAIRIRDVATVVNGFEKAQIKVNYSGSEAVHLLIKKKDSSDIVKTAEQVDKIIQEFNKTAPKNIHAAYIVDYSAEVKDLLDLVLANAKLGLILVIITLVLFLNFKVAFWTAVGIPTSIFFAFLLFPVWNITINFISLTGIIIVIGMLVDDAIIVGENIFRYREQGEEPREAAIKGTLEVFWPVVGSVSTTIVAFVPLMMMTGVFGKFMWMLPITVGLILLGSLLESLFILPSHMKETSFNPNRKKSKVLGYLETRYGQFLDKCLNFKKTTILISFGLMICSVFLFKLGLQFKLFPSDDGLMGYIKFETAVGTSLDETKQKAKILENYIATLPKEEVTGYVTTLGEATPRYASYGINPAAGNVGNIVLHFTPTKKRSRNAKEIMEEVHTKIKNFQGFTKLEADTVSDGPPIGKSITISLVSNNDLQRNTLKQKLETHLKNTKGTLNIYNSEGIGKNKIQIDLNEKKVLETQVSPLEVGNLLRTALDGTIITNIRSEGEEIDFRLKLAENYQTEEGIKTLSILNNFGKLIPISQFMSQNQTTDLQVINHYDGKRSITIFGDIDDTLTNAVAINENIKAFLEKNAPIYPEVKAVFGGEEQDTQESLQSLKDAMILALVGIYFILVIIFNSFSLPFLVMVAIPFSFAGVLYAFYLQGLPFSFPAMIGMVGLTGVVVNNSIVMLTFLDQYYKNGTGSIEDLKRAAITRFRPIFLTSLTTLAGLFPTAYGIGGFNPVIAPMTMAISWGLLISSTVTLLLLPTLYLVKQKLGEKLKTKFQKKSH